MSAKKHLEELMRFHEEKEAREAKEKMEKDVSKAALGKFLTEKKKNTLGEESKIRFLF